MQTEFTLTPGTLEKPLQTISKATQLKDPKNCNDLEKIENTSNYKFIEEDYERVSEAKKIILENLNDIPTVQMLSRKVGLNPTKLQIGFRMLFSQSIKKYAITAKMNKAWNLLQSGEKSCGEVAESLGYTNKGHFSKKFKEQFGILPSAAPFKK